MDRPLGPPAIERGSISRVPTVERRGDAWQLAPLWFSGNAELTSAATGVFAVSQTGSLLSTLAGLLAGTLFGTVFVALHAVQGPRLGLPQMIQSRAQFGRLGVAAVMLPPLILSYAGYNVFNQLFAAQSIHLAAGGPIGAWLAVITAVGFIVAVWGYHLIHLAQQWLTYGFILFFGIYTVIVLATAGHPLAHLEWSAFDLETFCVGATLAAGYQIGWAACASDYTRYLPENTSARLVFGWTFVGLASGAYWMFAMGAIVAAPFAASGPQVVESIASAGNAAVGGLGTIVVLLSVPALIMVVAMNMYAGALVVMTLADSFAPVEQGTGHRAIGALVIGVLALSGAYAGKDVHALFESLLKLLLYLFTPWTAINLIDYYVVRRGVYAAGDSDHRLGVTGAHRPWNMSGLTAYVFGLTAMTPFFVIGEYFVGPIANRLESIDVSVFVGLPTSAALYLFLTREGRRGARATV